MLKLTWPVLAVYGFMPSRSRVQSMLASTFRPRTSTPQGRAKVRFCVIKQVTMPAKKIDSG